MVDKSVLSLTSETNQSSEIGNTLKQNILEGERGERERSEPGKDGDESESCGGGERREAEDGGGGRSEAVGGERRREGRVLIHRELRGLL